jgi:hypothetical protein
LQHGLRLGLHCGACCAGLTAILLVIGVVDLRVMAVVTAAITPNAFCLPVSTLRELLGPWPLEQDCC